MPILKYTFCLFFGLLLFPSAVQSSQLLIFQITVGCCTVDILKQLSSEEISRKPAGAPSGDRMGRLATHLLSQHR